MSFLVTPESTPPTTDRAGVPRRTLLSVGGLLGVGFGLGLWKLATQDEQMIDPSQNIPESTPGATNNATPYNLPTAATSERTTATGIEFPPLRIAASKPVHLWVPSVGIDANVGNVITPQKYPSLGPGLWYIPPTLSEVFPPADTPWPSAPSVGTSFLFGHSVFRTSAADSRRGVFDNLEKMKIGDALQVITQIGVFNYIVNSTLQIPKKEFGKTQIPGDYNDISVQDRVVLTGCTLEPTHSTNTVVIAALANFALR